MPASPLRPVADVRPPEVPGATLPAANPALPVDAAGATDPVCGAIGAIVVAQAEISQCLDRLHGLYPSRLPSLEPLRGGSARDRSARLLARVSRAERNRACVRDLEFWLAACERFVETAPTLVAPHALVPPDGPRLERAAADGRWAATNLKRLCQWLEREKAARESAPR
jgi:hypothetical protein